MEKEDILVYGLLAVFVFLFMTDKFNMKNNYHKGLLFLLIGSTLYFKGLHYRFSNKEILPPLKDLLNKEDEQK